MWGPMARILTDNRKDDEFRMKEGDLKSRPSSDFMKRHSPPASGGGGVEAKKNTPQASPYTVMDDPSPKEQWAKKEGALSTVQRVPLFPMKRATPVSKRSVPSHHDWVREQMFKDMENFELLYST